MFSFGSVQYAECLDILRKELERYYFKRVKGCFQMVNKDFENLSSMIERVLEKKLAKKVRNKFGVLISGSTLKRLIRYKKDKFQPAILTKLSLFLGYNSWIDFMNKKIYPQKSPIKINRKLVLNTVKSAIKSEIEAYYKLPKMDLEKLKKSFSEYGLTFHNLSKLLREYKMIGWKLVDLKFNLFKRNVIRLGYEVFVITLEMWDFTWYDETNKEVHEESRQNYYTYQVTYDEEVSRHLVYEKSILVDAYQNPEKHIPKILDIEEREPWAASLGIEGIDFKGI